MSCRRIRIVESFDELVGTPFSGEVNALCWARALPGDFAEIARKLDAEPGITTLSDDDLAALDLSEAGHIAREVLRADQALLRDHGLDPVLDCVTGHPRVPAQGPIATDVYSFHTDSATDPLDTYLCTYTGACSEGLPNEMAIRRTDVPETRAALLSDYGGADDAGFAAYLAEHFYDLHYAPLDGAAPYTFGQHNLWRIALKYPGCPVAPCIHCAPLSLPGCAPRLLLIS